MMTEPQPTEHQTQPEPSPSNGAVGFDPKALATELGDVLKPFLQKEPEQQTLTPEQRKELLREWEPDDDFLREFGNLDTQKQAFLKMRDGLLQQFDVLAQARLAALQEQLQPIYAYVQQAQAREHENAFYAEYPQLKAAEFKPLIEAVTLQLKQSGKQFKTAAEAYKAVADGVAAIVRTQNPNFSLKPAGAGGSGTPRNDSIPAVTPGGGGGGAIGGSPAPKQKALAILGGV